jgi:uncharacterized membrane protein YdjX (TVP38/TMEM64 family)
MNNTEPEERNPLLTTVLFWFCIMAFFIGAAFSMVLYALLGKMDDKKSA